MSRRSLRRLAFGGLGFLGLVLLGCIADYRGRIRQGEDVQSEMLGRVIATREALLWMHPDILPYGGGSFIWIYRMQPGQFEREMRHCVAPPAAVDDSRQRNPYRRENTRECMLVNREHGTMRVQYQIILGNSTLWVGLVNF